MSVTDRGLVFNGLYFSPSCYTKCYSFFYSVRFDWVFSVTTILCLFMQFNNSQIRYKSFSVYFWMCTFISINSLRFFCLIWRSLFLYHWLPFLCNFTLIVAESGTSSFLLTWTSVPFFLIIFISYFFSLKKKIYLFCYHSTLSWYKLTSGVFSTLSP